MDQNTLELETAVIGALLFDGSTFSEVCDQIAPENFAIPTLAKIYRAMSELYSANQVIDLVSVAARVRLNDENGRDITNQYLTGLWSEVYTSANINSLVRAMLDQSRARRLLQALAEASTSIDAKVPIDEIIEEHQAAVFDLTSRKMSDSVPISSFAGDLSTPIEGVPTGFLDLDKFMVFENGNLIIIAGRPSMGKTALALSMAIQIAKQSLPVMFFSLEMSNRDVMHRIAAQTEGLKLSDIRRQGLTPAQRDRLDGVDASYTRLPIFINDNADWTPFMIRSEIRRLVRRHGIKIVFIDYLGLLHIRNSNSKYEEITSISKELKATAKHVGIPLVALHQLNRASESRTEKRPSLGDLRDSGAIEQDADIVLFPFRPSIYDTTKAKADAEIIVAKHRQGECKTVSAFWHGDFTAYYPKDVTHANQNH